jgi:hypothetical protein
MKLNHMKNYNALESRRTSRKISLASFIRVAKDSAERQFAASVKLATDTFKVSVFIIIFRCCLFFFSGDVVVELFT